MKKRHILLLLPLVLIITGCPFLNRLPVWTLIPDLVRNIGPYHINKEKSTTQVTIKLSITSLVAANDR